MTPHEFIFYYAGWAIIGGLFPILVSPTAEIPKGGIKDLIVVSALCGMILGSLLYKLATL